MKRALTIAALAAATFNVGCSGGTSDNAVTPEESAGLNNAADMLDASPDSLVANEEAPLGNGEEAVPADEGETTNTAQ
jgi:hypothetical protein